MEIRTMMENKRGPCSVDHSNITSLASKRQKADLSISTKDRKEKFGNRIEKRSLANALSLCSSLFHRKDGYSFCPPGGNGIHTISSRTSVECSVPPNHTYK